MSRFYAVVVYAEPSIYAGFSIFVYMAISITQMYKHKKITE